jgi:predicted nucleotidyltransferase
MTNCPRNLQDLDALLAAIRAELPVLRRMGVLRIGVFGSRARGSARSDSDVDLLVEFELHRDLLDLIEVKQHLESVLGLSVDVTTPSGIRPSDRSAIMEDLRYAA